MAVAADTRAEPATPLGISEEGNMKRRSDMTTGNFSDDGNGVGIAGGIASALRQRLETEPRLPMPEQTRNQQLTRNSSDRKSFLQRDGLGRRIVVEDEDELTSRILDTSGATFMSMTTTTSPEPIHEEDEEETITSSRIEGVVQVLTLELVTESPLEYLRLRFWRVLQMRCFR